MTETILSELAQWLDKKESELMQIADGTTPGSTVLGCFIQIDGELYEWNGERMVHRPNTDIALCQKETQ